MTSQCVAAFRDAIRARGYEPPERIEPGIFFRFPAIGKGHGNGAVSAKLFPDCEGGIVCDWTTGEQWTWQATRDRTYSPDETRLWREKCERAKAEAQAERARDAKLTAERAIRIWRESKPADSAHPYLTKKGVRSHGLRVYRGPLALNSMKCDGALIVPARSGAGDLLSLQFIAPTGEKRYLNGPRPAGCYFSIGKPNGVLCVAEGYATAASIYEATGHAVAVAFDSGSLESAARDLRAKFPRVRMVLCADDDAATEGNPGVAKATLAAKGADASLAIPDFGANRPNDATDFNDLARHNGPEAVKNCVHGALEAKAVMPHPDTEIAVEPDPEGPRAILRRFSEIESRPIRWLWPGRIARGKVSMLAGNPGLGKSQVTASMAAVITRGGKWPVDRSSCERGSVIFLSAEDDPGDTIRPRLEAAGADITCCAILDAVTDGYTSTGAEIRRAFNLGRDLQRLAEAISALPNVALVVIDPISAYLGDANSHNNAEVRALLAPLAELASRHDVAIVGVSHLNKGGNNEALMRVTGSLAFVAAARAAYLVAADKEDPTRRLFLPLKNNLGRDLTGLAFGIEPVTVPSSIGPIESSRVSWEAQPVTITADEAMAPVMDSEQRTDLDDAAAFLEGLLEDGPVPSNQVYKDAEAAGHSRATIRRAQRALGVEPVKDGMKGGWTWRLTPKMLKEPEDAQPQNVSTFAKNEHLREESADPWRDDAALMSLVERIAHHYRASPDELAVMQEQARGNPAEAWRAHSATAIKERLQ